MGADSGIHIETPDSLITEPIGVAKALQAVLKRQEDAGEKVDLIIMGKLAIDDDLGQTGQVLAGLLGWGQATFASKVTISEDEKSVKVKREIDGGAEELEVQLPAIITTDLRSVTSKSFRHPFIFLTLYFLFTKVKRFVVLPLISQLLHN